jgi:hypothetical protein
VRRACAKCIQAIVEMRPERVVTAYDKIAPTLIKRCNEREENVKIDVFDALRALLKQVCWVDLFVGVCDLSRPIDTSHSQRCLADDGSTKHDADSSSRVSGDGEQQHRAADGWRAASRRA